MIIRKADPNLFELKTNKQKKIYFYCDLQFTIEEHIYEKLQSLNENSKEYKRLKKDLNKTYKSRNKSSFKKRLKICFDLCFKHNVNIKIMSA
jgi:hypothetical protein